MYLLLIAASAGGSSLATDRAASAHSPTTMTHPCCLGGMSFITHMAPAQITVGVGQLPTGSPITTAIVSTLDKATSTKTAMWEGKMGGTSKL